jgi:hypothetical protein
MYTYFPDVELLSLEHQENDSSSNQGSSLTNVPNERSDISSKMVDHLR